MDSGCCFVFKNDSQKDITVKLDFTGIKNLIIRNNSEKSSTTTQLLINSKDQQALMLEPKIKGKETFLVKPKIELLNFTKGSDPNANKPHEAILNWVETIWPIYDANGNGTLDIHETWNFI